MGDTNFFAIYTQVQGGKEMCVLLELCSEIWGGGKIGAEGKTVCGNSCVWLVESEEEEEEETMGLMEQ